MAGAYYDYPTGSNSPLRGRERHDPGTAVSRQKMGPADITQAGGLSPYGTMAQGGNVANGWETVTERRSRCKCPDTRRARHPRRRLPKRVRLRWPPSLSGGDTIPSAQGLNAGFRVVRVVPEAGPGRARRNRDASHSFWVEFKRVPIPEHGSMRKAMSKYSPR